LVITEKDIFDYVYYRDSLSPEKTKYMEDHQNLFSENIAYYKAYQNSMENKVDNEIERKFLSEISGEDLNVLRLFPKQIELSEINKKLKLAADTVNLTANPFTQTFVDKNSLIMLRLVGQKGKTAIYIFSTEDKKLKNIKLELLPSRNAYQMENNQSYLEVDSELTAQEIRMSFEVDN
jgi:predicted transcriptional regulator with HTH domain